MSKRNFTENYDHTLKRRRKDSTSPETTATNKYEEVLKALMSDNQQWYSKAQVILIVQNLYRAGNKYEYSYIS